MDQENKTARIFLACAIGAGIGSLSALQLGYLWGLGALIGGLAGYLAYDFEKVISAIPVAWNTAAGVEINPEPIWIWFKDTCLTFCAMFSILLSLFMLFLVEGITTINIQVILSLVVFISTPATFLLSFTMVWADAKERKERREKLRANFKNFNPIMVYLYWPAKGIAWAMPRIPAGAVILYNFLKNLFFLIHSDLRLLCGVDSLIGAVIGYFTGNALIGALAGGMLGVADYEIISKRYLKVHLKS